LIVGGKPSISIPPFVIVGFEMLILFGGLATLAGVVLLCRLPRLRLDTHFDPRATEDHYVLLVETNEDNADTARTILRDAGAETGDTEE
jgi:molybdopterin-containing oxidoreductase family membrane subunit